MKSITSVIILTVFMCVESKQLCLGDDQNAGAGGDAIARQFSTAQELCKSGKTNEYHQMVMRITKEIVAEPSQEMCHAAVLLLEQHLSTDLKPHHCQVESLDSAEQLASFIMNVADGTISERQKRTELVARFLGRVRDAIIPDFKPLPVVANIGPPVGVAGFAGMDTNAVSDPAARLRYSELIEENRRNNATNRCQAMLTRFNMANSQRVIDYIAGTCRRGGTMNSAIETWDDAAKLSGEEREQLRIKSAR